MVKPNGNLVRASRVLRSVINPALWLHPFRMLHYYGYTHVVERARVTFGRDVRLAPNVSFANGDKITVGDQVQLGARCSIWAGRCNGRITIGDRVTFGPDCFVTAADYGLKAGLPITEQPMQEADVEIEADVWVGTKSVITAGVKLGKGCVVGAGSVVTRDVPENAIVAGVPARLIRFRT